MYLNIYRKNLPSRILDILKKELPQCFKYGENKVPLSTNIVQQVKAHYAKDKRFHFKDVQRAIEFYTSGSQYLTKIIEDKPRIDIKGNVVSYVTRDEAQTAQVILAQRDYQPRAVFDISPKSFHRMHNAKTHPINAKRTFSEILDTRCQFFAAEKHKGAQGNTFEQAPTNYTSLTMHHIKSAE